MSVQDKAKNAVQSTKGSAKELAGRLTHDKQLESKGKRERTKNDLKQAGEKVKDAIGDS